MQSHSVSHGSLLIYDPGKSRSTCHTFVSRRSPAEEASLGKLFIVAEISKPSNVNADIINRIQAEITERFYGTEDLNVETAFERALEAANQTVADLVNAYDSGWLEQLHLAVAVVTHKDLLCSYIGSAQAFIVRNNRISSIIESTTSDDTQPERVNPLKAFSNIITGDLYPEDRLLFCTASLLDYFSQEKIKRLMVEHPPQHATQAMEQLLADATTNHTAFAAVIVAYAHQPAIATADPTPVMTPATQSVPQSSLADLFQKQRNTNDIMTPSLTRYLQTRSRALWHSIRDVVRLTILRQSPRRVRLERERTVVAATPQESVTASVTPRPRLPTASLTQSVRRFAGKAAQAIPEVSRSLSTSAKTVSSFSPARTLNRWISGFKGLPRVSQIIIVVAAGTAFFLAQMLYATATSEERKQDQLAYDQAMRTVTENITEAEAAILYGNTAGAHETLEAANRLIAEWPTDDEEAIRQQDALRSQIDALLVKARKIVTLTDPEILAQLSNESGPAAINGLALLGETVLALDPTNQALYEVPRTGGEPGTAALESVSGWQFIIPFSGSSVLLTTPTNELVEHSLTTGRNTPQRATLPLDSNISDMAAYGSRLYYLDIKNNQLYRADRLTNGFGTPSAWIQDDTDVRSAVSLAIDGDVYVLSGNGTVTKLNRGQRQEWSLQPIEPTLEHGDSLWTAAPGDNLYVLDRKGQRIVEFTKEGALVNQYSSPLFATVTDFAIDPAAKKIYAASGNTINSFPLSS